MKIEGISASSYDKYSQCEWKWFLSYVLGFPDESGPAALIGTIGHKVLEVLSKAAIVKHKFPSKIWDVDYLWKISWDHYAKESPDIISKLKKNKIQLILNGVRDLVYSDLTPIRNNTIGCEIAFNLPLEDPDFIVKNNNDGSFKYFLLKGRIDRVDKINSDTIEIIDYKTGSRANWLSDSKEKKDSESLHKEIQPRMYHLAAKSIYPWAKNFIINFIYLTDGGSVAVPFCDSDISETKNLLKRRFKAIKANNDPQMNRSWRCKMCSYDSNICRSVHQEVSQLGIKFVEDKYSILNRKNN